MITTEEILLGDLAKLDGFSTGDWISVIPAELFQGSLARLEAMTALNARGTVDVDYPEADVLRIRLAAG